MQTNVRLYAFSIPWNLFLLTIGSLLIALSIKAVTVPHGLVSGGISGVSLLLYYYSHTLSPGWWLLLLNIPIALVGWIMISRRFLLYTAYGMLAITIFIELVNFSIPVHDKLLAAIASGILMGAGSGTCMRSLGSSGGLDIIGVILQQRFGFRIGQVSFLFNAAVFTATFAMMDTDTLLYSLILAFVSAQIMDYVLSMFNQRKLLFVISDKAQEISRAIIEDVHRGVTLLDGRGGYTGQPKQVVMTVVNNIQQKKTGRADFYSGPGCFCHFREYL